MKKIIIYMLLLIFYGCDIMVKPSRSDEEIQYIKLAQMLCTAKEDIDWIQKDIDINENQKKLIQEFYNLYSDGKKYLLNHELILEDDCQVIDRKIVEIYDNETTRSEVIDYLGIDIKKYCKFNGRLYERPAHSKCTNGEDNYNAWICDNGFKEINNSCIWLGYHSSRCDIKGNISYDTGEKIYHIPGCEYYYETRINTAYGERWFCSEADAIAAGWRKAYNC